MEEVGQIYLNKLVNRSLLQVVKTTIDGRLSRCSVHDILREIIVTLSRRENLVTIINGEKVKSWPNKVRRLAIHGPIKESRMFKNLRSLVLFPPEDDDDDDYAGPVPFLSKVMMLCGGGDGSRVLKVLDLKGAALEVIPDEVFKLYLLEYLSLRSTNVKVIPKAIGKLRKLETLDLKDTFVSELPVEILNLQRLRNLIVYHYKNLEYLETNLRELNTFRYPYKIGCLESLQKLLCIEAEENNDVKIVREIEKLTQLRRLGISKLREGDGKDFCFSLGRLTNLRSLFVASIENEILDLQYNLYSTPNLLRTLVLVGRLEKVPPWIPCLECLSKLILAGSRLKDEHLELEDLPNLVCLVLQDACEGKELHFKAGKFQRLKELTLWRLNGLKKIRVEKSSMYCLEYLQMFHNELMEEIPSGIEYLSNLQSIVLINMSEKLIKSLQNQRNRCATKAKISVGNLKNRQVKWRWLEP